MFRSPSGRNPATRARRFALIVSLLLVAASLPFVSHGAGGRQQAQEAAASVKGQANIVAGAEFVPGEVLVRFRTDAAAKTAEAAPASLRAEGDDIVTFARFDGSDIVRGLRLAKVDAMHTLEAVAELASRPDVLYAEPNYVRRKLIVPNDPGFKDMWGLRNTGQSSPTQFSGETANGIPGVDIGAERAWDITQGSESVVVGVVDEGIDFNHPDLAANIWTNPSDDADLGFPGDIHGWDFYHNDATVFDNPLNKTGGSAPDSHGTHVAGIIGARGNNERGVTGINWRVKLMSLKILGDDSNPDDEPAPSSVKVTIRAYSYAKQMRALWRTSGGTRGANIRVLNNSFGGSGKSQAELDAINALAQEEILFVVASGNDNTDNFSAPKYPSNYDAPNLLSVAATDHNDRLASYSNYSERAVSLGAPGSAILSTTPGNTYSYFWGTSMAAPHVAGAAALVCAAYPNITLSQLRGVLAFTGNRIPALEGKTTTGRRLNVANAIQSALENDTTAPVAAGNLRVTSQIGRNVTLAWTAPGDDGNTGTASDYDFFFINPTTGARLLLPTVLLPAPAGTMQSASVVLPYRNFSGTIELRTYDNAGNIGLASVPVTITRNAGSDPYVVSLGVAESLSTGGTPMNLIGDDVFTENYLLPFNFPFFGMNRTSVTVSSNGALYFSKIPSDGGIGLDAGSSVQGLDGQTMIAGMWDDIRTDRPGGGVFVVQDANRIIFRWQGVTFNTPLSNNNFRGEQPVNCEIELRSDGRIIMRYGTGQVAPVNTKLFPVVGISGGEPDAYVVASHTSEAQQISLTNAQTVTFALRPPTISGQVAVNGITGLAGVTLTLSGSRTATVVTDANGNYSFDVTLGGSYVITPSRANYTFVQPSVSTSLLSGSQTINFVAVPNRYTISGSVTDAGAGFAGVSVTLSGTQSGTTTTDANGNYSFANLIAEGNYTVSPSRPGMAFAPPGYTFMNLSANQAGANFVIVPPEPNVLQFSAPSYQFSEGAGRATVTVTRTGNTSGAITVDFITVDDPASVPCATSNGTAYARCDYATTIETLSFAAGDTSKNITIPLIDDVHVEQPETFQIRLLNPVNAQLGVLSTAPLTVIDNGDAAGAPNPIFGTTFFVRQQYLDFLSREPETGEPWSKVLNDCPDVNNNSECDRLTVSKSFFKSPEFQLKGFFVYRFYGLSFGRLPLYTEIVADMRSVTGATEDEVYQKKGAFSNNWVQRPAFKAAFDGKSSTDFVNAMMNSYALQTITTPDPQNPDRGAKINLTRADLLNGLNTGTLSRAQIVRAIADSDQVFALEYNRAYVAMQYFGYLRRDPDAGGFNGWLNYLSANPTDDRTMVRGFANSQEYQLRFGPAQ